LNPSIFLNLKIDMAKNLRKKVYFGKKGRMISIIVFKRYFLGLFKENLLKCFLTKSLVCSIKQGMECYLFFERM